jgi:hypothetical protein
MVDADLLVLLMGLGIGGLLTRDHGLITWSKGREANEWRSFCANQDERGSGEDEGRRYETRENTEHPLILNKVELLLEVR